MMEEIAKYGTPTTKRIYADWTNQMLAVGRCFIRARNYSYSAIQLQVKTLLIQR
jgi:hypothetical protein